MLMQAKKVNLKEKLAMKEMCEESKVMHAKVEDLDPDELVGHPVLLLFVTFVCKCCMHRRIVINVEHRRNLI